VKIRLNVDELLVESFPALMRRILVRVDLRRRMLKTLRRGARARC